MSVFMAKNSTVWQYEFMLNSVRYRGTTGCRSKRDAETFEAQVRARAVEDVQLGRKGQRRMTLGELAQAWLDNVSLRLSDHRNNESRVRKLFGETRINGSLVANRAGLSRALDAAELHIGTLMDLKESRLSEGNSEATVNREVALVQALLRYAKSKRVVVPDLELTDLYEDEDDGKLRWLTLPEERRLLDILEARVSKHGGQIAQDQLDLAILLLDTGARYMEAAQLMWSDVNLAEGRIHLYRPKVGKESLIGMTARVRPILERRRVATGLRRYVFPAGDGKKWAVGDRPRGYAASGMRSAIAEAGLNDPSLVARYGRCTVHTFRHTFASRLVQGGASLQVVQGLLGHATPAMTQVYAKLVPSQSAVQAVNILDLAHGT